MRFFKHIALLFLWVSAFAQEQFNVTRLPFCTSIYDEYAPVYFNDKIVFCSNTKRNTFISYNDTSAQNRRQVDLYIAGKTDTLWGKPLLLSPQLTTNLNEGPSAVTSDNKHFYFTRSISVVTRFGSKNPPNLLGIFFCDINGNNFTEPKPFLYNDPSYNVIHPAISTDGTQLIFASNMPGGFGGYDLYYCTKTNNTWSKPQNLGPAINTIADEAFPFFHRSGKLFFSSKGRNSLGGFDIYSSQLLINRWTPAINIGRPFNSEADDFGYIINDLLENGYFCSNRSGTDDIYAFSPKIDLFGDCKEIAPYDFCYEFYEEGTAQQDLNSTTMIFEWNMGDGTKIHQLKAEHCFQKEGFYHVVLNVIDSVTGEISYNQAQYELTVKRPEQAYITVPARIVNKKPIELDGSLSYFNDYKINQFSWDFGDGIQATGMKVKHTYAKAGYYTVRLSLEMTHMQEHTDKKVCYSRTITVNK